MNFFNLMNYYIFIFQLAGNPVIFNIRYLAGYPASQTGIRWIPDEKNRIIRCIPIHEINFIKSKIVRGSFCLKKRTHKSKINTGTLVNIAHMKRTLRKTELCPLPVSVS
jgi:hypothetical protein